MLLAALLLCCGCAGEAEEEHFVKASLGYSALYALTSAGNLYRYDLNTGEPDLLAENMLDVTASDTALSTLDREGNFIEYDTVMGMKEGVRASFPGARQSSNRTVLCADGTLHGYCFETESWSDWQLDARKVRDDTWGAVVLDADGRLWQCSFATGEKLLIAEEVLDFDYSHSNKFYYSSDIWYVDAENRLQVMRSLNLDYPELYLPPAEGLTAIHASHGYYLAEYEDGSRLTGHIYLSDPPQELPRSAEIAALLDSSYVLFQEDGSLFCHRLVPGYGQEPDAVTEFVFTLPQRVVQESTGLY